MCSFLRSINSRVQFRDTRLLIVKLILPLRLSYCLAGLCGSCFPTARVIYYHLYSALTVLCILKTEFRNGVQPQSKKGKFHLTAYYRKDDRVIRYYEITELSVSGRRYVAEHYFSNIEKEFDFFNITLRS